MSAIRYPVAPDAQSALSAPIGRASREREARSLAGRAVAFMAEPVGACFATREAALDAYPGRVDDDRPGREAAVAPEDRYCELREEIERAGAKQRAMAPVEPTFADGRRWPSPAGRSLATHWRLSVSYWRIEAADQARHVRRRREAAGLSPEELRAMASQPLRPVRPQQPLDTGLFEVPAPEAPHILIPDE
jgi:hypothetical protein